MRYYIMTAGSKPGCDYLWWQIIENGDFRPAIDNLPSVLGKSLDQLNYWLDGDPSSISVLLGRTDQEGKLLLLVTNLPTKRLDHQRRVIRNSLILIENDEREDAVHDQDIICRFAAIIIKDSQFIAHSLDKVLIEDLSMGFRFNFPDWNEFIKEVIGANDQKSDLNLLIEKEWENFRISTCFNEKRDEIYRYLLSRNTIGKGLPENLKIVLIITKFKDASFYIEHCDHGIGTVFIGENMNFQDSIKKYLLQEKQGWYVLKNSILDEGLKKFIKFISRN